MQPQRGEILLAREQPAVEKNNIPHNPKGMKQADFDVIFQISF